MKREFNVAANIGNPQVAYRETLTKSVEQEGRLVRQTGGRGQYGHCVLRLEPRTPGEGFSFVNAIRGGDVPREYIPAVEKGVIEAMSTGALAGYPVVDVKVTLLDGSYHPVDSSELAFHIAGSLAFRAGARKADPVLLEPIMRIEITTPNDYLGDVIGNLQQRRAKVAELSAKDNYHIISAQAPLAEMFGYATMLRSLSQGRANFHMDFSHYAAVPASITEELIGTPATR